jgi:hypothetical protein
MASAPCSLTFDSVRPAEMRLDAASCAPDYGWAIALRKSEGSEPIDGARAVTESGTISSWAWQVVQPCRSP